MSKSLKDAILAEASERERLEIKRISAELARRKMDALSLYEPLAPQEAFHACTARERILRGGNRAGKTVASAVEVARAARRRDPHNKYKYVHDDFIIFIVGYDQKHIGRKIHTVLLRPGAFQIIRDEKTREWRAFRPDTDEHRKDECKPAPPLIPRSEIKEFAWESRAKGIWNCITLHNGTRIYAFPSTGSAPQGDAVDLYWIDEDIAYEDWVEEAQARLPDRGGRLIWSAMAHSRNNALFDLSKRAEAEAELPHPDIVEFNPHFSKNPHISAEEKRKTLKGWAAKGEDVLARRDRGEYVIGEWLVYPNYDQRLHGLDKSELPNGQVPTDWTRYMVVDPGRQKCAVLFAAVPPPESELVKKHGDFVLLYDECYISLCDAAKFAAGVKPRFDGYSFHEWIMDEHGGRIKEIGSGRSIKDQYRDELHKLNLACERFGCEFLPGCDNIDARVEAFSGWMTIRPDGTTRLKVLRGALHWFNWEIERYRKKVARDARGIATDAPDTRRNTHLMACAEYLAARNPKYVRPKAKPRLPDGWAFLRFMSKKKKQDALSAGQTVVL